ncbi:hypothetical protein D2S45_05420 [Prevotella intermedia]|uniref:Uncharacterized protein n=1 Tax=Prevotella intermedia TaxID=28131 RepID=A0A3R7VW36_PREIN|nr:hypothetical protein D2S53_05880 [Prevotella intermedia]RRF87520.1 hypothetical protein D2S45_05420 [Prevotella intermedia]
MASYPKGYDAIFVFNRIKPIRYLKKELIIIQYAYNQKEVKFIRLVLTWNPRYSMTEKKIIKV